MENRTILVSGASIAGPALAYWLNRYGFKVTLVERAPALRAGGYKVDIRGAAVDAVERMGLLAEVRRAGTDMRAVSFVDRTGKPLVTMSADFLMGREENDLEIMRADLSRILYDATRHDAEYLFGDSITAIAQDGDGVQVTFEHSPPAAFDLVVGADGLHSNVRTLVFGAETPYIRHLGAYISIFTTANELGLDRTELFYSSPGRLANLYSAQQNGEAKALFIFASKPLRYPRRDIKEQKQIVANAFAGQQWQIPRLLAAMWDAPDFYFDSLSQIQMERWSNGRVVLVGDAGYSPSPASGQGTSLALVGAYVLAGELKAANGDYRTAYTRYEEAMQEYVSQNLALGQKMVKEMIPASQWQLWLRTQVMRALPYLPWKDRVTKGILEPIQRAATAITLQNYSC